MWHVVLSLDSELEKSTKSGLAGPDFGLRDSESGTHVPDSGDSQAESGSDSELADPALWS